MKKHLTVFMITCILLLLSACGTQPQQSLSNMTSTIVGDYRAVVWEGRIYIPFCVVSKNDRGVQIGYVDGDKNDCISEYKGYSPTEWLVSWLPTDGGAMLLKEENVADIPDGLIAEYQSENAAIRNILKSVLLGTSDFISTDLGGQSLSVSEIGQTVTDDESTTVNISQFTVIDLDGDGNDEVVLWLQIDEINDYGFEVLHYRDGAVYGYTFVYRAFMDLKEDGTFSFSSGAADSGIGRLTFSDDGYSFDMIANSQSEYDSNNELIIQYFADGEPSTENEFNNIINSQDGKADVQWYDFSASNLSAVLSNLP